MVGVPEEPLSLSLPLDSPRGSGPKGLSGSGRFGILVRRLDDSFASDGDRLRSAHTRTFAGCCDGVGEDPTGVTGKPVLGRRDQGVWTLRLLSGDPLGRQPWLLSVTCSLGERQEGCSRIHRHGPRPDRGRVSSVEGRRRSPDRLQCALGRLEFYPDL